ncbi:MAG: type I-E CRISPR-associated protein Cas6/Cse3/CasE [Candidatus Sumerlaeota bacterium]|nr:type I-E CRISPR-associated protein Cas6/Cse3/CasE [Candidatus Sumerlaeota bacterium]
MYLSCLLINVGDDPDRPRPGRLWLRNVYRVHQRLAMAFPSKERLERDAAFLAPFAPGDFAADVHEQRDADKGFLFRVDALAGRGPVIVMQSARRPDWDYAFANAPEMLRAPVTVKEWTPDFAEGERLRFRLRANPTMRMKMSKAERLEGGAKEKHRRVSVTWEKEQNPGEALAEWLKDKIQSSKQPCGFEIEQCKVEQLGWVSGSNNKHKMRFRSALFEGVLRVTDARAFSETIMRGIGSGKAVGFGLLSVAKP